MDMGGQAAGAFHVGSPAAGPFFSILPAVAGNGKPVACRRMVRHFHCSHVGGLVVIFLLSAKLDDVNRPMPVVAGVIIWSYALGAAIQLNAIYDTSPTNIIPTRVVAKRSGHGKSGPFYYLVTRPWGPFLAPYADVSKEIYEQTQFGDTACGYPHKGAFGLPYGHTDTCPTSKPAEMPADETQPFDDISTP